MKREDEIKRRFDEIKWTPVINWLLFFWAPIVPIFLNHSINKEICGLVKEYKNLTGKNSIR